MSAFWLPEFDALIAATTEDERLIVHDVIAAQPFDLSGALPKLIERPVTQVEFCFDRKTGGPRLEILGWTTLMSRYSFEEHPHQFSNPSDCRA